MFVFFACPADILMCREGTEQKRCHWGLNNKGEPLCQMQISIFANFAIITAWSYKPRHTDGKTFKRNISVLKKLNFYTCHRIFLKVRCRLLLLRCLWQFGSLGGRHREHLLDNTDTNKQPEKLCKPSPVAAACLSQTMSVSGGWATHFQKSFLKQTNKMPITCTLPYR